MRKKRRSNKTIYIGIAIAIAGLLSLLGVALIGANSAIHTAERTAERTLQYLRDQCISYQDIIAADRVKSLVRLTEQVQELTDRDRLKGRERSNEGLAEYAQQQRISCVLVLNDALEPVYSCGVDMDWSDLYTNESVSNIMQYPEKIFARRLTRDGVVYDVAAAARTVEPGMVFCVRRQSSAVIASYHASIESLLAGYETLLNEKIYTYITDGEKVIGSSDNGQWNLPVDSVPLITALEQADSDSCLTKLDCGGTFFGMRRMYQEYSLYVFLPADFVFTQTKNMLISAFGVYAAAVVVVLLLVRLGRDRKRRELAYQKQLEKEVERATAADQAKTHFLRSMSHDIRTPINIIMGMLEIIGRNPEDVTLVQSCREKAQTAARYLLALVNDVLTLNRPKQETLGKTPYCLTSELHEMLDISRAQAEIAGVALTVMDLTLEHERFTGDPLYMRQICQNIIGNAIKYNHPGGWVRCSFRESRDADGVCRLKFVCEDNGAGMSETFQRHMFEAFAQENSDRGSLSGGVGLGLAVVKKLVDERGGTIQVDSARGQGTRFRVVLPMMPSEAEEPEAALPDAAASIAGRRLLVAEDNELNREIAVYLLQEAGAMVDQAADGKEAVEMFAASAPGTYDAVLMDVMMPELDGHAAARAIRGMDRSDAQLPIIAMTANLFDEDVAACLAAGMDAHIPKPLEAGQMIRTIAEWLERKKQ
mgnify:CR=1 FL=1